MLAMAWAMEDAEVRCGVVLLGREQQAHGGTVRRSECKESEGTRLESFGPSLR